MKENNTMNSQSRLPYEPTAMRVTAIIPGRVLCLSTPLQKSAGLNPYEKGVYLGDEQSL